MTLDRWLRDVVALSTLPALWSGAEPQRIAESLAAALFTQLGPQLVFVSFTDEPGRPAIAVAQTDRYETSPQLAQQLGDTLIEWARHHDPEELLRMADPRGAGTICFTARGIGLQAESGVIAVGFGENDLPNAFHQLVLNIAATQAATAIGGARLLRSLRESEERTRRVNAELDHRLTDLSKLTAELEDSRRATLNLLEDALQTKEALRDSEARFRNMADSAPALLWVSEADGSCSFLSRAWCDYTGQSQQQALGFGWIEAVHPQEREEVRSVLLAAGGRHEPFSMDCRIRRADGAYRWVVHECRPRWSAANVFQGHIGSVIDVHERKLAEEALKDADRRKDEFLATLAHELRNPLAPLRNSLHLLRMVEGSPPIQRVHEIMDRQVSHMVRLVDDLLEVSRITRGKINLQREVVEIAAVVRNALDTSRPLIEVGGHEVALDLPAEPVLVYVDPVRFAQVIANLINNAAKYTEPGGHIRIAAQREGAEVAISVRDNGIGIPPNMLSQVFEMFTQIDRDRKYAQGGLGIGLALVKNLVEMHGGRVEARSEGVDRGSEFLIQVPIAEALVLPQGEPLPVAQTLPRRRILVVDDNRDAASTLALLLRSLGSEVETAHDGATALQLLESYRPSLIFLDLGMPLMSGYDVARRIRKMPIGGQTELIALTGWGQEEDRRRTQEAGFDQHLLKPVDVAALVALLGRSGEPRSKTERRESVDAAAS